MAQNQFINLTAGTAFKDGSFGHSASHASASANDLTVSWDNTKITTKASFRAALNAALSIINSRTDIPA